MISADEPNGIEGMMLGGHSDSCQKSQSMKTETIKFADLKQTLAKGCNLLFGFFVSHAFLAVLHDVRCRIF